MHTDVQITNASTGRESPLLVKWLWTVGLARIGVVCAWLGETALILYGLASITYLSVQYYLHLQQINHLRQNGARAEASLEERDALYRDLFDNASVMMYTVDMHGHYTAVNPAMERLMGYTSDEMCGVHYSEFMPPESQVLSRQMRAEKDAGAAWTTYETDMRTKAGDRLTLEVSTWFMQKNGERVGIQGIARDITERRKAELALKQAHEEMERQVAERTAALQKINEQLQAEIAEHKEVVERLQLMQFSVDQSSDSIFWTNEDGSFFEVNEGACRRLGYSRQELLNLAVYDVAPHVTPEAWAARWQLRKRQGYAVLESLHVTKDGRRIPVELTSQHLTYQGKTYHCAVARDMSERKHAEELVRQHHETLEATVRERTAELQLAKEAAEAANRAKSEFLANMSHELRTPLHGMLMFSGIGLQRARTATPEKLESYFEQIDQSGNTLLTLLDDLLDLAKLEAGKMDYHFQPMDLNLLLLQATDEFSSWMSQKSVLMQSHVKDKPLEIWLDVMRIKQDIRNLLNNAMKFSPEGGAIDIDLCEDEEAAVVTVCDQGPGIPEEELEAVFDKFIQSTKTKTGAGGTGLGLAICREIVTSHGGRIWAENRSEGGTRFLVALPKANLSLESV